MILHGLCCAMFEAVNMQNEVSAHVIYHICNEVLECLFKLDFSEKVPTSMNYEGSRASFFSHFEYIVEFLHKFFST